MQNDKRLLDSAVHLRPFLGANEWRFEKGRELLSVSQRNLVSDRNARRESQA